MIIINDKNETYLQLEVDSQDDFNKVMSFFTIKIPGAEFIPSVKMGFSDGTEKFITPKGEIPFGLGDKLVKFCQMENIEYQDNRTIPEEEITWDNFLKFVELLDLPFAPYKHQLKGAFKIINNKRVIALAATGSGKSLIIGIVIRYLLFKQRKTMLIVPTIDLVNQMYSDFEDYFDTKYKKMQKLIFECKDTIERESLEIELEQIKKRRELTGYYSAEESFAKIFGGQDKHTKHIIKISTYQSLSLSQDRVDPEYFEDVEALIIDETHKASGKSIQDILKCSIKAKFKVGLTGSLSDNILDNLKIEGAIGTVEKIVTMRELIDLGLATEIIIKPIFLQYDNNIRKEINKLKYQEEDKFIRTFQPRAQFLARLMASIKDKNKILIYKNIDCAEMILEELVKLKDPERVFKIKDYRKQNDLKIYYSQGATKSVERNNFRQYLEESDGCDLLGTTTIIATGINIKNLPVTIFENIGKSSTLTIQGLGRGARLHKNKDKSIVFDIVDDARYYSRTGKEYPNYKYRHWLERLDIYYSNDYIVEEPVYFKLSEDLL